MKFIAIYQFDDYDGNHQIMVVSPPVLGALDASFELANYGRSESITFFKEKHKQMEDNGGIMYLVNRAQTQQTSVLAHAGGDQHSKEEYELQLSLADYASGQTSTEQAQLADILAVVMKKAREETIQWVDNLLERRMGVG
jgi:hypothetical protein